MKIKNVFAAGMAMLCMAASAAPCYASIPLFQDVAEDHVCAEGIRYCFDQGYTKGVGNGMFAPELPITMDQFLSMEMAAFHKETYAGLDFKDRDWREVVETAAKDKNLASAYELTNQGNCPWPRVLSAIMKDLGLMVYEDEVWGQEIKDGTLAQPEMAIIASARHYGLLEGLDNIPDLKKNPTRAQLAQIIKNADKTETFPVPEIVSFFPVTFEDVSDNDRSWTYETFMKAPREHLQRFKDRGWEYIVTRNAIEDKYTEYQRMGNVVGLTDYNRKRILAETPLIIKGRQTLVHELGHFLSEEYHRALPYKMYRAEEQAIEAFLGRHAASNKDEAFADIYGYLILYRDNEERIQMLREAVPQCSEFVLEFINEAN